MDLGTLAVPAHIALRPGDLGLRLTADIPQRFKGLSLNLRSFVVALDRPDFAINPTNCSPLQSSSQFFSDLGAQATVPLSFQVTGCEKLAFDPQLGVAISGKTARGDKPSIAVRVGLPTGNSNLKSTSVTLPPGLGADLDQVTRACPSAAWDAGTCGADAVVGSLKAKVAIAPDQITGTVSMVKIAGKTLPGIGMQLEGRFATRLLGQISIDQASGQLVTSFPSLPDVPISALDLSLEGGPRGALISTQALCAAPSVVLKGSFTGQTGAAAQRTATTNCPGAQSGGVLLAKVTGTSRGKLQVKLSAPRGKRFKTALVGLPSTVSLVSRKVSKKKALVGTKTVKVRGKRTLSAVITKAGKSAVTLTLPKGSLLLSRSAKKKKTFTASLRVTYVGGGRETKKLSPKR